MREAPLAIDVQLPADEAWALAQWLKRARWDSYRALAVDDDEAEQMRAAGETLREALARQGCAPR